MNPSITTLVYPMLLSAAIILSSCSDGDEDISAILVKISADNAESLIAFAFKDVNDLSHFNTASQSPSVREIMALMNQAKSNDGDLSPLATDITRTSNCSSGSYTIVFSKNDNTKSGSLTFADCVIDDVMLNGGWTYSDTEDPTTSDYKKLSFGSVTASDSITGKAVTVSLTDFDFEENRDKGTYTTTKFTLGLDFTVIGISANAFKVELTDPIVASSRDSCPERGSIRFSGAFGTYAELTYSDSGTTLTANGIPVASYSGTCYV